MSQTAKQMTGFYMKRIRDWHGLSSICNCGSMIRNFKQFNSQTKHFLADFRPSSGWSHRPNTNHSKFLQFIPEGHLKPRKEVGFVSPTEHPVIKTSILPVQSQRLRRLGQSLLTYILHTGFNFQTIIQALHWHVHWCGPSLSS